MHVTITFFFVVAVEKVLKVDFLFIYFTFPWWSLHIKSINQKKKKAFLPSE